MARREKHRRAERLKRAGVMMVLDEAYPEAEPAPRRLPRNGYQPGGLEEMVLHGLQHKRLYQGNVDPVVVQQRRAQTRRARVARRTQKRGNR